jgi:hypothetical protein
LVLPLKKSIDIPFIHDKPFYAVRIVPYFKNDEVHISIPTMGFYGELDIETGELKNENEHYSFHADYDPINP